MFLQLFIFLVSSLIACNAAIGGDVYSGGERPVAMVYDFDCSDNAVRNFGQSLSATTGFNKGSVTDPGFCADALSPGFTTLGSHIGIPIKPKTSDTVDWRHLRNLDCCKGSFCPGCYDISNKKRCVLKLYTQKASGELQTLPSFMCFFCRQLSCFVGMCKNGEYSATFADLDPVTYMQLSVIQCIPCKGGTWNTCVFKDSCQWSVPEKGFTNISADVHHIGIGPVFSCYRCEDAGANRFHYMDSVKKSEINPLKTWKCPGGTTPPTMCPNDDFVPSQAYDSCVCKPGYYSLDDKTCIACEAGSYCENGQKKPCKLHHYQPLSGQSSCIKCVESGDETGVYNVCPDGTQLQWCDPLYPETQRTTLNNNCIPCKQCVRSFIPQVTEQRQCYKSN